ncbi:MAG TPA: inorganic diphosphatase [Verrucomicrobiae bacterium]
MKKAVAQMPAFDPDDECVNVIVETPKGSRVKYAYQPECGLFYAKRVLPDGMMFPFNFGFIPSTLGEDGDPLDILLVNEEPAVTGCLVKARLLAVMEAEQSEQAETSRNDRIVGLIQDEETPPEFQSVRLDEARMAQIGFFFAGYNKISGKEFKVLGTGDPKRAKQLVREGIKRFEKQQKD